MGAYEMKLLGYTSDQLVKYSDIVTTDTTFIASCYVRSSQASTYMGGIVTLGVNINNVNKHSSSHNMVPSVSVHLEVLATSNYRISPVFNIRTIPTGPIITPKSIVVSGNPTGTVEPGDTINVVWELYY